jgi:hypothetical protein
MPSLRVSVLFGTLGAIVLTAAVARLTLAQDMPPSGEQPVQAAPAPGEPAPNAPAPNAQPAPATPVAQPLSQARLDALVAPVALYPDPLLSQMLMASTYPLEIVEAQRWVGEPANKGLSGDALANALTQQGWDPSVKALVPFPRVLDEMSNQLSWTEQLGDAFLAQQADVMTVVQRLRHEAMAAGNLKQTPECRCTIQTSGDIISILPAVPQEVCVPVYNPRVVYGAWPEPAYPPVFFPAPVGFVYDPGFWIGFEPPIELAFFGPLWGWSSFDWHGGRIVVDNAIFGRLDPGHGPFAGGAWVHDPAHRGGVAYADPAVNARFGPAARASVAVAGRVAPAVISGRPTTAAVAGGRFAAPATGSRFGEVHSFGGPGRVAASTAGFAPHALSTSHAPAAFHARSVPAGIHAAPAHFAPHGGAPHGPAGGGVRGGGGGHHH